MPAAKKENKPKNKKEMALWPLLHLFREEHILPFAKRITHQWSENQKIPQSLLITGPQGSGKQESVYFLTQWIFCENGVFAKDSSLSQSSLLPTSAPPSSTEIPCNQCPSCKRALESNWIDFSEISPEISSTGKTGLIKIDQIREIKKSLGYGAHQSPFKIIFIREAENLTHQAANALLKILEEPPKGWIFFLSSSDPSLLLPTIVSRCQRISLSPISEKILKEILTSRKVPSDRAETCIQLASGNWKRALALSSNQVWERRLELFDFFSQPETHLNSLVDWATKTDESLSQLTDQVELIVRDLLLWSLSNGSSSYVWMNQDGGKNLLRYAQREASQHGLKNIQKTWTKRCDSISIIRKRIKTPVNKKLLAMNLLVPWMS